MAQLHILYWRDIPSQVVVKAGRKTAKRLLPERFQQAIDAAAMKGGADNTDDYLSEWRRGAAEECDGDMEQVADARVVEIDTAYDAAHLRTLIAAGGHKENV